MKYFIVILLAAVCYARPQYDYTPQQQHHQHHGSSHGGGHNGGGFSHGGGHNGGGFSHGGGGGGVQVTKHVYVHVPPPDTEENFASQPAPAPPVQKHYKIIFIKAPSAPAREQFASPQLPQTEEKTVVYVLVKKPDENLQVDSAPLPQHTPSKPEVFFIKYKTKSQPSFGSGTSSSFNFGNQGTPSQGSGFHSAQPPSTSYGAPSAPNPPSNNYGPPQLPTLPDNSYGPPHK